MKVDELAKTITEDAESWREGKIIYLNSCNAGRGDNSIAQQLSKKLHTTVIAPTRQTWTFGAFLVPSWQIIVPEK